MSKSTFSLNLNEQLLLQILNTHNEIEFAALLHVPGEYYMTRQSSPIKFCSETTRL